MSHEMFGKLGDPKYREYANDIHRSGNHLLELINEVLDVSKVEAGAMEMNEDDVDLAAMMKECAALMKDGARKVEIELRVSIPKNLPEFRGDSRRLKQIFLNLLSNAIKFTPAGSRITLDASIKDGGGLKIAVADTGIGMDADGLAKAEAALKKLPNPLRVYAGTVYKGSGNFRGTGNEGGTPRTIHVLHRGDIEQPKQIVAPGTLRLAKPDKGTFNLPDAHAESERRVALAKWLTQVKHPLTWRSIVNRVWQYHFGTGIVATPNDFGRMGAQPTHPELLDWLAAEFRDNGQSIKQLHRQILTSATYRQSSNSFAENEKTDGQNKFLWRMNRRQLEAEAIRDAMLQASGSLTRNPLGGSDAFNTNRRSIYVRVIRNRLDPFLSVFDAPAPNSAHGVRAVSNVLHDCSTV